MSVHDKQTKNWLWQKPHKDSHEPLRKQFDRHTSKVTQHIIGDNKKIESRNSIAGYKNYVQVVKQN